MPPPMTTAWARARVSGLVWTTSAQSTIVGPAMANRSVDELLDLVPVLRDRTAVSELVGGLTNTNYKVETPSGRLRRAGVREGRQPACDRPRERVPQLGRGGHHRGRCCGDRLPPRRLAAGVGVHLRRDPVGRGSAPRRQDRDGRPGLQEAALRPGISRRLQHVPDPAALPRPGAGARLPAARPLRRVRPQGARDRGRDGGARRGRRALQQRSAGRELHRRRRRVSADRLRVFGHE